MPPLTAHLGDAVHWVRREGTGPEAWNPVYRALAQDARADGDAAEHLGADEPAASPEELDLLVRQLCAPALLVLAVTDDTSTRRLRIALAPEEATLEQSTGEGPSRWWSASPAEVPTAVLALLEGTGAETSPHLAVAAETAGLRLSAEQLETVRAALAAGASPAAAFAAVPGLDPRLRDALTATGPRLSLSLTLHDPTPGAGTEPVTWSRLWVRGQQGLYRTDATGAPMPVVHPVPDGDVLGTVLPVLEEGLRFAAAQDTRGGAR